jgi:hypothetical protein
MVNIILQIKVILTEWRHGTDKDLYLMVRMMMIEIIVICIHISKPHKKRDEFSSLFLCGFLKRYVVVSVYGLQIVVEVWVEFVNITW